MGGGVALLDYDNDGRLDVFFTNGAKIAETMPRDGRPDKSDPGFEACEQAASAQLSACLGSGSGTGP